MKNKIRILIACSLLATMILSTLSGCGFIFGGNEESSSQGQETSTKADDIDESQKDTTTEEPEDSKGVVNTEENVSEDVEEESDDEAVSEDVEDEVSDDNEQYNRDPENLNGFELNVLAVKTNFWKMHTAFAPTQITGDSINRVVFNRNEMIKKAYNASIVAHEDAEDIYGADELLLKYAMSGLAPYDAAYVLGQSATALSTESVLHNLYDVPELQLEEKWWSSIINDECTIGTGKYKTLYFTQSNLSLTAFDLTWCVYFNKTMHETYQVEDLYELVKEGKWTVEQMKVIAKGAASLNGDASFTYYDEANAVYGATSYWNGAAALLIGCDPQLVAVNRDGDPEVNLGTVRFSGVTDAIADFLGEAGAFTYGPESEDGSTVGNSTEYIKIFNEERALFCIAEVKSSVTDFKNMEQDFGMIPMPKYDETQEEYRSWVNYLTPTLVIPKSIVGDDLYATAILLDALSFYSERDVLPEYYNTVLKGRGAKDYESIEMLDKINATRVYDSSMAWAWTNDFVNALSKRLLVGNKDIASLIGENEIKIQKKIDNTLKVIYGE